ncbi:zinc-ribbon domain-containing protein [Arthrobacter sp. MI7-26]|uniref:zinc-ribbon domain-containing protein n=1 Tax=Arthrobacter sp. MI7-26 TaxID=2993653 RepID=UPI002248E099|nr:zinc-ribbon domain-containing protein [Arthrobacter sp. MI7-26]MCX2748066.1 zinc-ribbon domain-containing protein [Arthrobacter sp. MI7-26]
MASQFPEIAATWHPYLNGDRTPSSVAPYSNSKAWWLGDCSHPWEAVVANRTRLSSGCPYCANQRVGYGNDLATRFPELSKEWHPTRNGDITPSQVTSGARSNVWWLCSSGHEWRAMVFKRSSGAACEKCKLVGLSELEIGLYAELKAVLGEHLAPVKHDYRIETAGGVKVRVDVIVGTIAVEFDGSYWHEGKEDRDREKTDQLQELGYRVIRVREHPLEALSPQDALVRRAPTGHEVATAALEKMLTCGLIEDAAAESARGYILNGVAVAEAEAKGIIAALRLREYGELSLDEKFPAVAGEWHPQLNGDLTPAQVMAHSGKPAWWLCPAGHAYEAVIGQRTGRGNGCGQCSGRYVTPATSLAVIRPDLADQWHPTLNGELTPEDVLPHSGQTVWWLCAEGHATQDKVRDRAKGMVCQECPKSRRRAETSLAARFPELASQWHPTLNGELTPEDVRPYLNQLVWWLCPNGHSTQDTLTARSRGRVCQQPKVERHVRPHHHRKPGRRPRGRVGRKHPDHQASRHRKHGWYPPGKWQADDTLTTHFIEARFELGENAAAFLHKGGAVIVTGREHTSSWGRL